MLISTPSSPPPTYSPPSIWSLEAIPARPIVSPAKEAPLDSMTRASAQHSSPLLTRFARALFSERIRTRAERMLPGLGGTFDPDWRLLATLFCPSDSERVALGLTIDGIGCGCSASYGTMNNTGIDGGSNSRKGPTGQNARAVGLLPTLSKNEPGWENIEVVDRDGKTPTHTNQRFYHKETGRLVQKGLRQMLRHRSLLPTLNRRDYNGSPGAGARERGGHQASLPASMKESGQTGPLNPRWCEAYMGFPDNWTEPNESPPSETP